MRLLAHLLRLVIRKQQRDVKRMELNVAKLQEITFKALAGWFAETEVNAQKRQYVDELFRVAKEEERLFNGEIGKIAPYVQCGSLSHPNLKMALPRCTSARQTDP